ncbi:hypothetical protein [Bradyrhizobium sp. BWC-3-1]|uniref:hypothetical protein n=1 Tax=Bradyrhizobium sp. BWC-3-1 TaxID=3080012 RepID=UPI00293F5B59|nr:hypothetical protein [Bradyrhizobium sp. BWC-3-1]WOH61787.1 hypothetical protein RX329_17510 [Bradyrhizobium sp. BWC-3-1]
MAKNSSVRTGGPARVRLVVLDAEIPDGDLASFNQVLQNALRGPGTTIVQQRVNGVAAKTLTHQPATEIEGQAEEVVDDLEEEVDSSPQPAKPRAKRAQPKSPNVVPLDMHAPTSLTTFAQGKDSKTQVSKYMIAAAWLKECRGIDAVNADYMFTCFKSMGWSTNIPDFTQPLRVLKAKNKYFDKSDKGYAINHIGLDFVNKLGGSNGAA